MNCGCAILIIGTAAMGLAAICLCSRRLPGRRPLAWTKRKDEFQKRGGFAFGAYLAYRDKPRGMRSFWSFEVIEREAGDERNFCAQGCELGATNIGKRNLRLNRAAIATARRIQKRNRVPPGGFRLTLCGNWKARPCRRGCAEKKR